MAEQPYDINLDVKFEQLERIDVGAEAAAVEPWFNQTLTQVNDAVVRDPQSSVEGDREVADRDPVVRELDVHGRSLVCV